MTPTYINHRLPLAIVGASARAAAASAARAGFQPVTADLFADADLREIASTTRIAPYPEGLLDWLRTVEPPAWMYTGALENHHELIDQMAWIAPLWGNPGDVLSEIRDPLNLAASLRDAGHRFPDTRTSSAGLPLDGSWLTKTYRGASGSGVRAWQGESLHPGESSKRVYQQRVSGVPCSAVYVAGEGSATLLGVTKQLVGVTWLHGNEFHYAGSIAPFVVSERAQAEIARVGTTLAAAFDLVGLFGVDFVLDGDYVWTLEVNPRYTASVEVIERATGANAVSAHAAACCGEGVKLPPASWSVPIVHGKAIVFADRPTTVREPFFAWALTQSQSKPWPELADISPIGTTIASGHPVATVFAAGGHAAEVERLLRDRVREVEQRLYDE